MKNFIVFDNYSEYTDIKSYKELKELLFEEIERDTIENAEDKDIIKNNFKTIRRLMLFDNDLNFIEDELLSFGYSILDLRILEENLTKLQAFFSGVGSPIIKKDCIEETIQKIKEVQKNES